MYNLKIVTTHNEVELYISSYHIRTRGKEEEFFQTIQPPQAIPKGEQLTIDNINDIENDMLYKQLINRKTTLNRARNNIMRLIKSNDDMKTFITLTFAKEPSYKESKKMLNNFFTKLRKRQKDFKYIWVLELGDKNKRLHYHLLTNLNINIKTSYKSQKSEEQKELENTISKIWSNGFVDIRNLENEIGVNNIAKYVTSYIVKGLQDIDIGSKQRIYGYSNKTHGFIIKDNKKICLTWKRILN